MKKPVGPAVPKPATKPAAGAPPAKTKAEPAAAVPPAPEKTQEPPIDLSKVVVSSRKVKKEFGGGGRREGYSLGNKEEVGISEQWNDTKFLIWKHPGL